MIGVAIGTTVTALLAATVAGPDGLTIAVVHRTWSPASSNRGTRPTVAGVNAGKEKH